MSSPSPPSFPPFSSPFPGLGVRSWLRPAQSAPESVPESALSVPELALELAPESVPESAPELAPESAPELALELAPESVLESAPGAGVGEHNNNKSDTPLAPYDYYLLLPGTAQPMPYAHACPALPALRWASFQPMGIIPAQPTSCLSCTPCPTSTLGIVPAHGHCSSPCLSFLPAACCFCCLAVAMPMLPAELFAPAPSAEGLADA